jgi:hypothetical protein
MPDDANVFVFLGLAAVYLGAFGVLGNARRQPRLHLRLDRRQYGKAFVASVIGFSVWFPIGGMLLMATAMNAFMHYLEVPRRRGRRVHGKGDEMEALFARLHREAASSDLGPVIEGECVRLD